MSDYNHNIQEDNMLLHLAVIEDNHDVMKFLLKHGVPVNARAANKQLALEFLTDVEHRKHLEVVMGATAPGDEMAEDQKTEIILAKTTTALHLAVRHEKKEAVELLIQHGADVNAQMEGGETPLIIAVIFKRQNVVESLIQHGADINAKTIWGKSALHYAAQAGQKSILEVLLKNGGHINAASEEGLTCLHMAAEAGHKDVVALLLKNSADLDIKTKSGATVLHYAAVMGHKDIVELILGHGADINVIMKNGNLDLSPFSWVTEAEEKKTWELVARYTAKMSIVNWYNTMVMRLYRKSKERKSIFQAEAEFQQQQQQQQQEQKQQ